MKRKFIFLSLVLIIFAVSCVTVNIYFPAAAVQRAADEIVDEVRGKEKKPEQKPEQKQEKGGWLYEELKGLSVGPTVAFAQIDVEVSTPAIRAIKEHLKERFPLLRPFYERGNIGENNAGLLDIRETKGLGFKEKADLARLLDQENKERRSLYTEIMKANKFGPEVLPQIQKIFANSWREKSRPGWWIQNDKGEWIRK